MSSLPHFASSSAAAGRTPADAGLAEALLQAVRSHVADLLGEEDPEFVQDLVSTFCDTAHELVAQARAAGQARNLEAVGKVAHQLKGSASNVGLGQLEAAWQRVEAGARVGDMTVVGLPLADATALTEQAAAHLDA